MIMPVKYTDDMIVRTLDSRAKGVKWAALQATYGEGIKVACSRYAAAERKRRSREGAGRLELQLPPGTERALLEVLAAAGDSRNGLISQQIHKLYDLLKRDRHAFDQWVSHSVTLGDLSKYLSALGAPPDELEETDDED